MEDEVREEAANYDRACRLDDWFIANVDDKLYEDLFSVLKLVLILSHGNAAVESGFSVNKALLEENLSEKSVIAQRLVYDSILSAGGVFNVEIGPELLKCAKGARAAQERDLEQARKAKKNEVEMEKSRRRREEDELRALEERKRVLQEEDIRRKEEMREVAKELAAKKSRRA